MKKSNILIAIAVMFAIAAFGVSAQISTVDTFDKTKPTFGSSTEVASNPKDDDLAKRNIFETVTIQFKNDGSIPITIDPTQTSVAYNSPFTSTDSALQMVSTSNITINNGLTQGIDFKARISEKLDAIDSNGDTVAFNVGKVTLKDTTGNVVGSFDVFIQRENELEMSKLSGTINDKEKKSLQDGDKLDNLKPGDHVELEGKGSNRYDSSTNLDVENIKLEIKCDNEKNFNFDDKSQDVGDLSPGDDDTQTITLDIEQDATDRDDSCTMMLTGKDLNGAKHGEFIKFDMKVVRKSHDIQITSVTPNPTSLTCSDKEINLGVTMLNLGRSDENHVAIEVTSKAISYQERVSNIEMNQDDSQDETFVVPVDPTKLKAGPFAIQVQTFYDNTKSSNTQTVQVDNLCNAAPEKNTNTGSKNPIVQGALELDSENIKVAMGSSTSIPVKVTNLGDEPVEYMVALADTAEFADGTSSKSVFLNPQQQSTVLLNLKAKAKVDAGKFSGIIVLKDSTGKTLETKTFTVDVIAGQGSSFDLGSLFGGSDSRVFWIIGDVILIIIAIFFIRLIFTGGKRKQASTKKLADYEAEMSKKKPARRRK